VDSRDDSFEDEADDSEPAGGWLSRILIVLVLASVGTASAFAWKGAGGPSFALPTSERAASQPPESPLARSDIEAIRQQMAAQAQSSQQLLAAQQAEIKRLTDQVASLSGRLDQRQRPVASAPAVVPVVNPSAAAPVAKKKTEAQKPVASSVKPVAQKLIDTKPTGAVSTGGAPLPTVPLTTPRPAS
jgi:hypothetical protein